MGRAQTGRMGRTGGGGWAGVKKRSSGWEDGGEKKKLKPMPSRFKERAGLASGRKGEGERKGGDGRTALGLKREGRGDAMREAEREKSGKRRCARMAELDEALRMLEDAVNKKDGKDGDGVSGGGGGGGGAGGGLVVVEEEEEEVVVEVVVCCR